MLLSIWMPVVLPVRIMLLNPSTIVTSILQLIQIRVYFGPYQTRQQL